jgi:hypothetical protein
MDREIQIEEFKQPRISRKTSSPISTKNNSSLKRKLDSSRESLKSPLSISRLTEPSHRLVTSDKTDSQEMKDSVKSIHLGILDSDDC